MRASRLLSILTTLQARGHVTARALADECEVSLRTIYRDIEALSIAGIPVYSERGSEGGYRLLDGYRVRLNGLSPQEAEALFLTGLSGPAADLGFGAVMATARKKLLAALPQELRTVVHRASPLFHLDTPAWFGEAEQPAYLREIADAVWRRRRIRIRYQSWKAQKQRLVEPLGIVLKGGAWYLAGQVEASVRTYRISRILSLEMLDESFERPGDFDLAAYWKDATGRLEADLRRGTATVRLSPWGVKMLAAFSSPYVRAGTTVGDETDGEGWRIATLPIGSLREATVEFLRFGAEAEVLDPPELRASINDAVAAMAALYRSRDG